MKKSFCPIYSNRKVLVTGHTGFKGGWLVTWLKMLGAQVTGFSLPPEQGKPSLYESAHIHEKMVSVFGDIRDLPALTAVCKEHEPEIIFHLAAQSLVRRSYLEPVDTFATNVMGSVHVLEAIRRVPSVRAAVVVTSDKCYENPGTARAFCENDPMGGHDPYSASKGCAELLTAAYRKSFFSEKGSAAVASVRAGNVIGGGDWADDRLVPDIVRSISAGVPVVLRNPGAVRPWQHVLDPLAGYLLLGQQLLTQGAAFAEAWNFGPHNEESIPVLDLAEKILSLWGAGELKVSPGSGFHEAGFLALDCAKANERLGWQPLLHIEKALALTVLWYRSYLKDHGSAGKMTEDQIREYMDIIT